MIENDIIDGAGKRGSKAIGNALGKLDVSFLSESLSPSATFHESLKLNVQHAPSARNVSSAAFISTASTGLMQTAQNQDTSHVERGAKQQAPTALYAGISRIRLTSSLTPGDKDLSGDSKSEIEIGPEEVTPQASALHPRVGTSSTGAVLTEPTGASRVLATTLSAPTWNEQKKYCRRSDVALLSNQATDLPHLAACSVSSAEPLAEMTDKPANQKMLLDPSVGCGDRVTLAPAKTERVFRTIGAKLEDVPFSRTGANSQQIERPRDTKLTQLPPALKSVEIAEEIEISSVLTLGKFIHPSGTAGSDFSQIAAQTFTATMAPETISLHASTPNLTPTKEALVEHGASEIVLPPVADGSRAQPGDVKMLIATPGVLEIGLESGTRGWLRVRAEVGHTGDVSASLVAPSVEVRQKLHDELPRMFAYLKEEQISVSSLAIVSPTKGGFSNAPAFTASSGEPDPNSGRRGQDPQDLLYRQRSTSITANDVSWPARNSTHDNAMQPVALYAQTAGSWLSVRV